MEENKPFEKIKEEVKNGIPEEYLLLKKGYDDNPKKGILDIAKFLIGKYNFKTVSGQRIDVVYIYKDGIYTTKEANKTIKEIVQKILQEKFSVFNVNAITDQIMAMTFFEGEAKDFGIRDEKGNTFEHLICIKNGILNLKTKELIPHTPDHIFLSKISVVYNPEADCPNIKEFIKSTFYQEDIPVIQEWSGYVLFRRYIFKKALILLGNRDSGKTTYVELMKKFIGEENHCALSLQEICYDKFAISKLYGRFLNSYDDLNFTGIKDAGKVKMLTGGGTISGDKKFLERITFNNYAKLLFATNQIPQVKQNDPAYYSRWIIINCDETFDEGNSKTDRHLIGKITTKEEMSGFLNWALEGLSRLFKEEKFSYKFSLEEVQMMMEKSGSTLSAFVQDELRKEEGNWISKEAMYKEYEEYVGKNGLDPRLSKAMVGRELRRYALYIVNSKQGKLTGWRNVAFKTVKTDEILNKS